MAEIETNMPQAPLPASAPVSTAQPVSRARDGKTVVVAAPAVRPGASKAKQLGEVVSFMRRLSAFEKHSSQVNFLVR